MTLRKIARTNAAGTCLYCGQRLAAWRNNGEHFCTGGCAERFGLAAARCGFRLREHTDPEAATANKRPPRHRARATDLCRLCDRRRDEHDTELHAFQRNPYE